MKHVAKFSYQSTEIGRFQIHGRPPIESNTVPTDVVEDIERKTMWRDVSNDVTYLDGMTDL